MNMTPDVRNTALPVIRLLNVYPNGVMSAVMMVYEIQSRPGMSNSSCIKSHRDGSCDTRIAPVEYIEQQIILDQQLYIAYASALVMSLVIRSCL